MDPITYWYRVPILVERFKEIVPLHNVFIVSCAWLPIYHTNDTHIVVEVHLRRRLGKETATPVSR